MTSKSCRENETNVARGEVDEDESEVSGRASRGNQDIALLNRESNRVGNSTKSGDMSSCMYGDGDDGCVAQYTGRDTHVNTHKSTTDLLSSINDVEGLLTSGPAPIYQRREVSISHLSFIRTDDGGKTAVVYPLRNKQDINKRDS